MPDPIVNYDGSITTSPKQLIYPETVIALFGIGPVDLKLADPNKPSWRRV